MTRKPQRERSRAGVIFAGAVGGRDWRHEEDRRPRQTNGRTRGGGQRRTAKLAVIEIATKSEATMIPIARLRALADKVLGRL